MGSKTGKKRAGDTNGKHTAVQSPPKRSKQQKQPEPMKTDYQLFQEQLKKREEQLDKVCVLLEQPGLDKDNKGNDLEPTMAQLQPLRRIYVPKQMEEYHEQVASELDLVGEDELGWGGTTYNSHEMHAILKKHLRGVDKAIKAGNWEDAFCYWVGVLSAAKDDNYWYADSDAHAVVFGIYERLVLDWIAFRGKSDEELGGLATEEGAQETVKQQLQWWVEGLREGMTWVGYDHDPSVPGLRM